MKNLRFALYIIVVVLLNIAATTLFIRFDLTENRSYSLSKVSKELVRTLEEPLTIKVFLSQNLPVPYNNIERDLRDILLEYKFQANKNFNYTIEMIDKENSKGVTPETYNIYPVNIQSVEQDEVKVVSAYIGVAFIHGDLVDTIPAIQYNQNLELLITNKLRELTDKSSTLLGMDENINLKLYMSPILYQLSDSIRDYKEQVEDLTNEVNKEYFNRLDFDFIEPSDSQITQLVYDYNISTLNVQDDSENVTTAVATLLVEHGSDYFSIDILSQDLFGRTVIVGADELKDSITSGINKIVGAKTKIGYLSSNGTIPINQNQFMSYTGEQESSVANFLSLIQNNYTLSSVDLTTDRINEDIQTLVIARPTEKFTDRELYLLDQFLMKGNSIFLALNQVDLDYENSNPNYGVEKYKSVDHGLYELLKNYGIDAKNNVVMDLNSFNQVQRDNNGGLIETQIYFAPEIKKENMDRSSPIFNGVNDILGFRMSEISPVDKDDSSVKTIISSSDQSWLVEPDQLSLDPNRIFPQTETSQYSLAVLKDSNFTSYFSNKEIPKRTVDSESETEEDVETISGVAQSEKIIPSTNRGKLLVLGSSELLSDSLVTQNRSSNVVLLQNILDYLSNRSDYIEMRSKGVLSRPMDETTSVQRNFIRYANVVGLPLLVALGGFIAYMMWIKRKKDISKIFMEDING